MPRLHHHPRLERPFTKCETQENIKFVRGLCWRQRKEKKRFNRVFLSFSEWESKRRVWTERRGCRSLISELGLQTSASIDMGNDIDHNTSTSFIIISIFLFLFITIFSLSSLSAFFLFFFFYCETFLTTSFSSFKEDAKSLAVFFLSWAETGGGWMTAKKPLAITQHSFSCLSTRRLFIVSSTTGALSLLLTSPSSSLKS